MHGSWRSDGIYVAGDAKQRYHDARGYGEPTDDEHIRLDPVEAAHLLYRGDLETVDGDGFTGFLNRVEEEDFLSHLVVYKDLRERGYYLRPLGPEDEATFVVFERGSGPIDGSIAYRIRVVDERSSIDVASLQPGVLAIVDEEAEVGFIAIEHTSPRGDTEVPPYEGINASVVGRRVLVWRPPKELYTASFFGQPLGGRDAVDDVLQLSLVEAKYLAANGIIDLDDGNLDSVIRELDGKRFDRRFAAYRALREAGTVPKTGYKFGADFRVYRSFRSLEDMGHSDQLIRVLNPKGELSPMAIALDVRLAHGVGKRMLFARGEATDHRSIDWLSIERVTP